MKIRMTEHREGGWNEGGEWRSYAPVGEVMDVSDAMGADLCAQGAAKPVTEERKAETRPAPQDAETRSEAPKPAGEAKPNVNDPKAAWVAWGARHGEAVADLEKLSKADLVSRYGG